MPCRYNVERIACSETMRLGLVEGRINERFRCAHPLSTGIENRLVDRDFGIGSVEVGFREYFEAYPIAADEEAIGIVENRDRSRV
jgi:hypothetical protein